MGRQTSGTPTSEPSWRGQPSARKKNRHEIEKYFVLEVTTTLPESTNAFGLRLQIHVPKGITEQQRIQDFPEGGAPTYYLETFLLKMHENEINWTEGQP